MLSCGSFIQASGWFCSGSGLNEGIPMDVLSEVLKAVKLDGAVFFHGEFAAPWCAREPDAGTMAEARKR